jgi:hypothetical protein
MLIVNATKKPAYHQYEAAPVVSFAFPKQEANATSNKPAIIKRIKPIFQICAKVNTFRALPDLKKKQAERRRQRAKGKRQKAEGKKQKAKGKGVLTVFPLPSAFCPLPLIH